MNQARYQRAGEKHLNTKPTPEQQIRYHRETIAILTERIALYEMTGLSKDASWWKWRVLLLESCIRACEKRITQQLLRDKYLSIRPYNENGQLADVAAWHASQILAAASGYLNDSPTRIAGSVDRYVRDQDGNSVVEVIFTDH